MTKLKIDIYVVIGLFAILALSVISGSLYFQLQQFREGTVIAELAEHEDEVVKLQNWQILNVFQESDVSPNQRLLMKVDIEHKWNFDSTLYATIEVMQAGELIDITESTFFFSPSKITEIKIPFFLKNEGPQDLKIQLLFRNQTNNEIIEQRVRHVSDLEVLSFQDKQILHQNSTLFWTQVGLISTTVGLVIVTWYNMRQSNKHTEEQIKLTRKEIEFRLKADIEITVAESNLKQIEDKTWRGSVKITVRNNGTISARNVKLYFQDPSFPFTLSQLIQKEEEIKKNVFLIPGSIPERSVYHEHVPHETKLEESKVYELAIWVSYDYADVKNMELIQIVKINGQTHTDGPIYENKDIEKKKTTLGKTNYD